MLKSLLARYLPQGITAMLYPPRNIVWIVHPRDFSDISQRFWMLRVLPSSLATWFFKHSWPFVLSTFANSENENLGYVIATPLVPEQFSKHPRMAKKKLRQALALAEKLGAKKISLAGFLSSVMQKNKLTIKPNISIFDGTTLMPQLAVDKIKSLIQQQQGSHKPTVGIIGATTHTGELVSKLVPSLDRIEGLVLLGRTQSNLDNLAKDCLVINPDLK